MAAADILDDHLLSNIFLQLESGTSKAACRQACKRFRACVDHPTTKLTLLKQGEVDVLQEVDDEKDTEEEAKSRALTNATKLQQRLQRLLEGMPNLSSLSWREVGCFWGATPLTALLQPPSPQLRSLNLHRMGAYHGDPAGWGQLFNVLGQLSTLHELSLHVQEVPSFWSGPNQQAMPIHLLIPELVRLGSLTHLCIKGARLSGQLHLNALQVFSPLTGLQSLTLEVSRHGISYFPSAEPLSCLTQLTSLTLQHGEGLGSLEGLEHLTGLRSLTATVAAPVSLQPLGALPGLSHLQLERSFDHQEEQDLEPAPAVLSRVADLRGCTLLNTLRLYDIPVRIRDLAALLQPEAMTPASPCKALQVLDVQFEQAPHTVVPPGLWAGLACCSELRELRLGRFSAADPAPMLPPHVLQPSTTKLTLLGDVELIGANNNDDASAAEPVGAPQMQSCNPDVLELTLYDWGVSNRSLQHVALRFPHLRKLKLMSCDGPIGRSGLGPLASLHQLDSLYISLGNDEVEALHMQDGVSHPLDLSPLQQCMQLRDFRLRCRNMYVWAYYMRGCEQLAPLTGCPRLTQLEVWVETVGAKEWFSGLAELAAQRPDLQIWAPGHSWPVGFQQPLPYW